MPELPTIALIGLGRMGAPMAANLVAAGYPTRGFDVIAAASRAAAEAGVPVSETAAAALRGAEVVITMLPSGQHVHEVYEGDGGILALCTPGTLVIDSSTIDVYDARAISELAAGAGLAPLDAPVSGGVVGAEAATLTFMVGGAEADVARARPILETMGKRVVHCGGPGSGQAAKVCNNMILGVSMIAVSEAFVLAEKLGLSDQALYDVASTSSGQCWALSTNCPVPGPVPTSPANRDYEPGFAVDLMLKDLRLARDAVQASGAEAALGAHATEIYEALSAAGAGRKDFSEIYRTLAARAGAGTDQETAQ